MGKTIVRIYKYDQRNWTYPYSNTTFSIPTCYGTSIQTQSNSYYDTSVGANDVASFLLDQSTNHHINTDVKNNDDSQSFETPRENSCSSSYFGDTIATTTKPQSYTLTSPGK